MNQVQEVNGVQVKFRKTRMCTFFQAGNCSQGTTCQFAHVRTELVSVPDLSKTKLCFQFFRHQCHRDDCKFAHGYHELRGTSDVYKTQMCHGFQAGFCRFGDTCRYAHGDTEIRTDVTKAAPPAPEALPIPSGTLTRFVSQSTADAQLGEHRPDSALLAVNAFRTKMRVRAPAYMPASVEHWNPDVTQYMSTGDAMGFGAAGGPPGLHDDGSFNTGTTNLKLWLGGDEDWIDAQEDAKQSKDDTRCGSSTGEDEESTVSSM